MTENRNGNIAIDGPAGAGKSTIAKKVAAALGCVYVDTGAMYRAMALYLLRRGLQPDDAKGDPDGFTARVTAECANADISIAYRDSEQVVLLGDEDVSRLIRTEEVSGMASVSSAVGPLREKLVELQRRLAARTAVVMDGRDIGTVVLPDAAVKVFLTASVEERARRRYLEYKNRHMDPLPSISEIEQDIADRDHRDMTRENSPLRRAEDALLVDSSEMTIDEVCETILNIYNIKCFGTGANLPDTIRRPADLVQGLEHASLRRPLVITAATAGFCSGVQQAVDTVYEEAGKGGRIFTYGPIIHNEVVVEDLAQRGVRVIHSPEEIGLIQDQSEGTGGEATIVIRSHGVPKTLFEKIRSSGAKCVDTTCTFVKRIHEIVEKESREGKQIVIIGNHGHAEVEGTMGWSVTPAVVLETAEEAMNLGIAPDTPLCVVAQTTFNGSKFEELVAILRKKGYNVLMYNTICNATRLRQSEARTISSIADVMIVIGGKGSSNTAKLYEICRAECERTFYVQTVDDLNLHLSGTEKIIGITAGASTPKNIIEEVQNNVRRTDF